MELENCSGFFPPSQGSEKDKLYVWKNALACKRKDTFCPSPIGKGLYADFLNIFRAEKLLKDELSNKEAQVKLVEKMLGDAKLN